MNNHQPLCSSSNSIRETVSDIVPNRTRYKSINMFGSLAHLMRIKKHKIAHSSSNCGPYISTGTSFHDVFGTVESGTERPTDHNDDVTTRWPIEPNINTNVLEFDIDSTSSITIQDIGHPESEKPSGHIECMLEAMNLMFVSPYRRDEYQKRGTWKHFFMLAACTLLSTLAFLKSVMAAKHAIIYGCVSPDLKTWTRIGYRIVKCVNQYLFISLVFRNHEKISAMLLQIRKSHIYVNIQNVGQTFSKLTISLGCISFLISSVKVIGGYTKFDGWSFMNVLQDRAHVFANNIHNWDFESYVNTSDVIYDKYHTANLTVEVALMSAVDSIVDFCQTLQTNMIRDLLLVASLSLVSYWSIFEKRITAYLIIHVNKWENNHVMTSVRFYNTLKLATNLTNNVLAPVYKFIVIEDLLAYAYLFGDFRDRYWTINFFSTLANVLKASILFYVSVTIHSKNENTRKWLRQLSKYDRVYTVETELGMTIDAAMNELQYGPIAFGSDYFLIDESFLVGFFTAVGSMIGFLVDSEDRRRRL